MNWQERACQSCTAGQICPSGLDPPKIMRGFWARTSPCSLAPSSCANFSGHSVFQCFDSRSCGEDGACSANRAGQACSLCIPGHFGGPGQECKPCVADQVSSWLNLLILVPLVMSLTIIVGVFLKISSKSYSIATGLRKLQTELWNHGKNTLAETYRYIQVVSVISFYRVSWPPMVQGWFGLIGVLSTQVFSVSSIACLQGAQSASLELGFRWAFPFVTGLVAVLTPLMAKPLSWALRRASSGPRLQRLAELVDMSFMDAVRVVVWVVLLFYTTLISNGLLLVTCVPNPNGRFTVRAFPNLECQSSIGSASEEWLALLGPCLCYLVVICVGSMLVAVFAWRRMVGAAAESNLASRGDWAFLTSDLRTSHLHWIVVVQLKNLTLNLLSAVVTTNVPLQLLLSGFVFLGYGTLTLWEQPFNDGIMSSSEFWTSLCLSASCAVAATGTDLGQKRCGIVCFHLEHAGGPSAMEVKAALEKRAIFVAVSVPASAPLDGFGRSLPDLIRASVHYLNTQEELAKLVAAVAEIASHHQKR